MTALTTLARLPLARLGRSRRGWLTLGAWAAAALAAAALLRSGGTAHGADHALLGAYSTVVLPFVAFVVVGTALGGESLVRAGSSLWLLGAPAPRVARAAVAVVVVASAVWGGVLAAAVAALAHGTADPPRALDAARSLEIGALAGAAYGSFFALGASLGPRGVGRTALLVVDWVLGVGRGPGSVLTPRAHVRNLLGGEAPLDLSSRASFAALVGLTLFCAAIAVARSARAQWTLPR